MLRVGIEAVKATRNEGLNRVARLPASVFTCLFTSQLSGKQARCNLANIHFQCLRLSEIRLLFDPAQ